MASRAATEEGVEEESCRLLTSFRVRSLDLDSLLLLGFPFLVLVGITTGLVVDAGVSIFGGMDDVAALSFLETRSTPDTSDLGSWLYFVEVSEGGEL